MKKTMDMEDSGLQIDSEESDIELEKYIFALFPVCIC